MKNSKSDNFKESAEKDEIMRSAIEITNSSDTSFFESAANSLLADPYTFLTTPYKSHPKGVVNFDINDPFLYYIHVISIIYIVKKVIKFLFDTTLEISILQELFKIKSKIVKPKSHAEAIKLIMFIYKKMKEYDKLSDKELLSIINKQIEFENKE